MRPIDSNTLAALGGSRAGDKLTVYVWYGGDLAHPEPLNISGFQFSWDTGRQVQQLELQVQDPEGVLAPWLIEDPLGVGGSRLEVRYDVGGAGTINIGWYRITRSVPEERWHSYIIDESGRVNVDSPIPAGKKHVMVSGGATINLTAHDLASFLKKDRLLTPGSPAGTSPTIIGEVTRLVGDTMPVVTAAGVTDIAVNKTLIYERDRLDAIQDLCKRISCDYRLNGAGQFEVYPLAATAPVAVLQGGPEGLLVDVDREQDVEGLYNQFVVEGTTTIKGQQVPVRSITSITTGSLSIYGPHGRVPEFYESTMITTQAQADAYAAQMMTTMLTGLTVDLNVTCLPLLHLQQGDWVQVGNPVVNGQAVSLVGRIKSMSVPSNGTAPAPMTLTVECSYTDVQIAIGGVDRG